MLNHMQLLQERVSVLDVEKGKMKECFGSFHVTKIHYLWEKITWREFRISSYDYRIINEFDTGIKTDEVKV